MKSRADSQLSLPPMPLPIQEQRIASLPNQEQGRTLLPKQEQPPNVLPNQEQGSDLLPKQEQLTADEADDLSAQLVDVAIEAAKLTNGEVGFLLGISESLVRKMRSPQCRERMSHGQMLRLGFARPRFYIELNIALNDRTGWFFRFALQLQHQAAALFAFAVNR